MSNHATSGRAPCRSADPQRSRPRRRPGSRITIRSCSGWDWLVSCLSPSLLVTWRRVVCGDQLDRPVTFQVGPGDVLREETVLVGQIQAQHVERLQAAQEQPKDILLGSAQVVMRPGEQAPQL